ncbi:hypothetical protein RvY_15956 [Ramazzottius varieornatus]|uniref:Uncharacterized protein n=1 Tax=Ramazzottius varieornatus TaxID=947166 RepID=A0A1D1VY52_RAMVA|nr:hypothetical protein RvY_15956 [Ramazzottius varieornatus]
MYEETSDHEQYPLVDDELNGFLSSSAKSRPLQQQTSVLQNQPSVSIYNVEEVSTTVSKILDEWALSSPDICLTFVSGTRSFTSWKNEDHRAALQKGIIKLMNATETWIVDNGVDYGCSKLVGNAVRNELQFRRTRRECEVYARGYLKQKRHSIMLMGVIPAALLAETESPQPAEATEAISDSDNTYKFEVNPSHSHYVYVRTPHKDSAVIRANFVTELVSQAGARKSPSFLAERRASVGSIVDLNETTHEQVPLIVVLIQGGEMALEMVCQYLKNSVPILILKGTGFMADILALSFEDYKERGNSRSSLEAIGKDISKRLLKAYPDLSKDESRKVICDRIMDCVVMAGKTERELISVVDCSEDLVNLDNYFLPAIFSARPRVINLLKEQVRSDFLLTMKLNKPAIAESKVLGRDEQRIFQADNELFEKALLWKGREKFVEKFMEEDFVVHRFLSHTQLLRLFRKADDTDFFITVVWNQIPRHYFDQRIEESFVTKDLNQIVGKLSSISNFLSMHELSSNFMGQYVSDPFTAERKAMNALIVWAVLMNRMSLAKSLWKFCEDPIPIALFISALYRGLAKHSPDSSMVDNLRQCSKTFSCMAIDVLDMSYKESGARTFDLLNQKFTDFNNLTPIKLAYISENRYFLAHEACQIWLNRLWSGGVEVTTTWNSVIPLETKLILSALFIFPIYFWIQYPRKNFKKDLFRDADGFASEKNEVDHRLGQEHVNPSEKSDRFHISPRPADSKGVSAECHKALQNLKEFESTHKNLQKSVQSLPNHSSNPSIYADAQLPLWRKAYYLWSAPRTKFWISQVFYWVYLAIFSIAVVLPTCNDKYLDVVVLVWTLLNVAEMISRTIYQRKRNFPVSMFRRWMEIGLTTSWVFSILFLKSNFYLIRPIYTRIMMCAGLLYMYYRMTTVFFPINPTLGPMLYRFKKMMTQDFYTFARLATPFVLANMFVLQAAMYPDLPFSVETFRKGFYRAFFTLFISFVSEFDYTQKCENTRIRSTLYGAANSNKSDTAADYCWVGDYEDHRCPTLGIATYVLNMQFLVIVRLMLLVLLNALFAATAIKVKEEADAIFKYERYRTVLDFASRSALPPPFSVLNYMFNWTVVCCYKMKRINRQQSKQLINPRPMKLMEQSNNKRTYESYSYWMGLTKEYYRKKAVEEKDKKIASDQLNRIKTVQADTKSMKAKLARMSEKVKQNEKTTLAMLEEIRHILYRRGHAKEGTVNVLSRSSPYPGTNVERFAVTSSYVAWDDDLENYDPPAYSMPVSAFPAEEQPFVDDVIDSKQPVDRQEWRWYEVVEKNELTIDRRSWIKPQDSPTEEESSGSVRYLLDAFGLPQNPSGRTGLLGRGSLHRYGPNHSVMLILSRRGDEKLRFLVAKNSKYDKLPSLFPMRLTLDGRDPFAVAVELLQSLLESTRQESPENRPPPDLASLRTVFHDIVFGAAEVRKESNYLDVEEIYAGYFDHPLNTDNAWLEVIVLHVKIYTTGDIAKLTTDALTWKERSGIRAMRPFEEHVLEHVMLSKEMND